MTGTYRLLVTGTRDEAAPEGVVLSHIDDAYQAFLAAADDPFAFTLVHGACPSGVDLYADLWARAVGITVETHPADWTGPCDDTCHHGPRRGYWRGGRYFERCPAAGPRRNRAMVALGADLCLAFPLGASPGTRGCAQAARDAGIPTRIVDLGRTSP